MDEEDRFLKARQEREALRVTRTKEASEETQQRERFETQVHSHELEVATLLAAKKRDEAQQALNALRALVQDTCTSVRLTAHDMAKCNATVVRLQEEIDQCDRVSGETDGAAGVGGGRRFKFSSKAKANVVTQAPTSCADGEEGGRGADTVTTASPAVATFQPPAHGDVYGPHNGPAPLFVRPTKAAFVRDCRDCTILAFPIAGSAFFVGCHDCRIYLACHQLRMKDCHNVEVYVWCASNPIIESCDAMCFGPYSCWEGLLSTPLPGTDRHAASTGEWVSTVGDISVSTTTEHNYTNVDDFQWLRKHQSPHWRVLTSAEQHVCHTVYPPDSVVSDPDSSPTA